MTSAAELVCGGIMPPKKAVDLEAVAQAIAPFAETPDFLVYGEAMGKTPVSPSKIVATRLLLLKFLEWGWMTDG